MTTLTIEQAQQPDWLCRVWTDESQPCVVTTGRTVAIDVGADSIAMAIVRSVGDGLETTSERVSDLAPIAHVPGLHDEVRGGAEELWQAGREHGAMEEREGHEVER